MRGEAAEGYPLTSYFVCLVFYFDCRQVCNTVPENIIITVVGIVIVPIDNQINRGKTKSRYKKSNMKSNPPNSQTKEGKKKEKEEKIAIAFCSAFGPHVYRRRLGFCTYREKEAE